MAINVACSVPGDECSAPGGRIIAGMCVTHYGRDRRHGNPLGGRARNGAPAAFIRMAVAYSEPGCLLWPYGTSSGYGRIRWEGREWHAHRLVLTLTAGPAPKGMEAGHVPLICHKPLCVSPLHLRWVTSAENSQDAILDGTVPNGERHHWSKFTAEDVHQIRHVDQRSNYEMSLVYDCTPGNIYAIRNYLSWKHLP